jgi:endonuclease YncB( thermonuclease family)
MRLRPGIAALLLLFTAALAHGDDSVVLNFETGKYHRSSCPFAARCSKACAVLPLSEAMARDGRPCKRCAASEDPPAVSVRKPEVILDQARTPVRWVDGDTFTIDGPDGHTNARVSGYNTLETYGAVHRWGSWSSSDLQIVAKSATEVAASGTWRCQSSGGRDGYGRALVRCPDLARELVGSGLAMVFAVDEPPDRDLLRLQAAAQALRKGIWAAGVPTSVVTSVHSVGEPGSRDPSSAYNRIVDARTGVSTTIQHRSTLATCTEVCVGTPADGSCMIYVPSDRRHRNRPSCLAAAASRPALKALNAPR